MDYVFDYINKQGGVKIDINKKWHNDNEGAVNRRGYGDVANGLTNSTDWDIKIGDKNYTISIEIFRILKKHPEYEGINRIIFYEASKNFFSTESEKRKFANNVSYYDNNCRYLGFDLHNINKETYLWESVAPKEVVENKEYFYSVKDLSKWND